jgi:hypothetical protein
VRLVGLQQLFVDGDDVVHRGGEGIFRGEAVVDGNDLSLRQISYGDTFDERAGIRVEAAAMKIDKHAIAVGFRRGEWSDDVGANSGKRGLFNVDGEEAAGFGGLPDAPLVGALATGGEIFGARSGLCERGKPLLRFRADGRGHGDDACEVGGAVGIKGGGVLRNNSSRFVASGH